MVDNKDIIDYKIELDGTKKIRMKDNINLNTPQQSIRFKGSVDENGNIQYNEFLGIDDVLYK